MFFIIPWNNAKFHADIIVIKFNNSEETVTYKLKTEELNRAITPLFYIWCFIMLYYHG